MIVSITRGRPVLNLRALLRAAVIAGALLALACGDSDEASAEVVVTGGGETFTGPRDAAIDEANDRAGFEVRYLDDERFELQAIALQDDLNGVREPVRRAEHIYRDGDTDREGALPAVMITEWTGRQAPLSGGRQVEPEPESIDTDLPGLELLRIDFEGAAAFTAYFGETTSHIIFYDPAPADVLEIIEAHFRD